MCLRSALPPMKTRPSAAPPPLQSVWRGLTPTTGPSVHTPSLPPPTPSQLRFSVLSAVTLPAPATVTLPSALPTAKDLLIYSSPLMEVSTMEGYNTLLRSSCAKIVTGRHRKGGVNIHKNLLVLTVITKVQIAKNKFEASKNQALVLMETEDLSHAQSAPEIEEEPPLEFSVMDNDDDSSEESKSLPGEVAFASEAIEESAAASEERRKRKSDRQQPPTPRSKSQRVSDRAVPVASKAF